VDRHAFRGVDANAHLVSPDAEDGDFDLVANLEGFANAAGEYDAASVLIDDGTVNLAEGSPCLPQDRMSAWSLRPLDDCRASVRNRP
jgi:hypothetical protein